MSLNIDSSQIVTSARLEADRMRAAVLGKEDTALIRMSAAQFQTLALLIERLADHCVDSDRPPDCWLDDDEPLINGFRNWVPINHFAAARETIDACHAEISQVRLQLQARDADYVRLTSMAFGLQPAGSFD